MTIKLTLGGLLLAGMLTPAAYAQAQQPAPATIPANTRPMPMNGRRMNRNVNPNANPNGGYRAADPATRARRMTDELTKQLGLDDATAQKVYALALTRDQTIDAIQTSPDDNRTKNTKLKTNADAFKAGLQGVLTPAQFQQFQGMKRRGRGNGGTTPPNSNTAGN